MMTQVLIAGICGDAKKLPVGSRGSGRSLYEAGNMQYFRGMNINHTRFPARSPS